MALDAVEIHKFENLSVGFARAKVGLETEVTVVAEVEAAVAGDVLVPCNAEPIPNWRSVDCLHPFQRIP